MSSTPMDRLTLAHLLADFSAKPSVVLASVAGTVGVIGFFASVPLLSLIAAVLFVVAALPLALAWLLGWRA